MQTSCHSNGSDSSHSRRSVQAPKHNPPWFEFWFLSYVYCLLVYIVRFPTYPFFFTFSLLAVSLSLSFPLRIDPLRSQAGCRKKRLNLALVFSCLFCVVVHFFWLMNACFCCVRFSFSSIPSQQIGNQSGFKWGKRWWGLGMQWHQLDYTQTICTSLQADNHTNASSLNIFLPVAQPTVSKHWRQKCKLHYATVVNRPTD